MKLEFKAEDFVSAPGFEWLRVQISGDADYNETIIVKMNEFIAKLANERLSSLIAANKQLIIERNTGGEYVLELKKRISKLEDTLKKIEASDFWEECPKGSKQSVIDYVRKLVHLALRSK